MKKTALTLALWGVMASHQTFANDEIQVNTSAEIPASSSQFEGILAKQGESLHDWGITPHLSFTQMYYTNPGVGVDTGHSEAVSLIVGGLEFDLEKIAGLKGAKINFEELYVPWIRNLEYGNQASSVIVGTLGPYIPQSTHLTRFTYEQKLLDDKATIELGKSNAGNFFATPMCNSPTMCVSASLQKIVGINPPPYANWSARFAYHLNPQVTLQTGWWRSDAAFPFTNGWESNGGKMGDDPVSNIYLASVAYRSDFSTAQYPLSYEFMGFYNDAEQRNPFQVNSDGSPKTSKGIGGFYASAKKTIWRQDGGQSDTPFPRSVSAFANMTHNFNEDVQQGIENQGVAGLILNHAFASRPFDSYSVNFLWAKLTDDEQNFLKSAHLAAGGKGYPIGKTEKAVSVDANFILSKGVILSPFFLYSWDSNSYLSPNSPVEPESGLAAGITLHLQLDQILGLSPNRH